MRSPEIKNSRFTAISVRLAACVLFSIASSVLADQSGAGVAGVPKEELQDFAAQKTVWIDVRSWVEYQADHIQGDLRIAHGDIVAGVTSRFPDKNTPIRLYCAVGGRAGTAMRNLQAVGYTDVGNAGGIDDARAERAEKGTQGTNTD